MAGAAVTLGTTGNVTFNALRAYNTGLFEITLGRDGVQSRLGSGGVDVSLGTLQAAGRGFENWGKSVAIEGKVRESGLAEAAAGLRAQWGYGDAAAKGQLESILEGGTVLLKGSGEEEAQTVREDGLRTVYLNGYHEGMSAEERLGLGVVLQHEAHRDGVTGEDQELETVLSVYGHTAMAQRMLDDGRQLDTSGILGDDLAAYQGMLAGGGMADFVNHVLGNYDSSADYWLLTNDGKLLNDGYARVMNENGNVVISLTDLGMIQDQQFDYTTSLAKMFGISNGYSAFVVNNNREFIQLGNNSKEFDRYALDSTDFINALKYNLTAQRTDNYVFMNADEKMDYLKQKVVIQSALSGVSAGMASSELRDLLYIKNQSDIVKIVTANLLFDIDKEFMDSNLRDFINLNWDGTMNYDEAFFKTEGSGWYVNKGNAFHLDPSYVPETITKWNDSHGREVIFATDPVTKERVQLLNNLYRGTANYASGNFQNGFTHYRFDMDPYFDKYANEIAVPWYNYILEPVWGGKW
jgi:hypothetical protein